MLLTIGMMVKNEAKYLEECLESLNPILEALNSELIIVDTGSEDRTVDIAKKYTDNVYFHEWNNNFSEMRNKVINYSSGKWFFTIDGDEVLNDQKLIIDFFKSGKYKKFNTATLYMKNYTNLDKKRFSITTSFRLFRNDETFHYEGAIHNQPIFKEPIYELDATLEHYGYIEEDNELMEKKFKRTVSMLKKELKKDPNNIYYWFQLSRSYIMYGDNQKALEAILEAYNLLDQKDRGRTKYIGIYIQLSKCYLKNNKYKKAVKFANKGIQIKEGYLDLYFYLGEANYYLGEKEESIKYFKKYIDYLNNYDKTNSKFDTRVDDETLSNIDFAYKYIVFSAQKLDKHINLALDLAFKIEEESQIKEIMKPLIYICVNKGFYNKLKDFFGVKLLEEHSKNEFLFILEQLRLDTDKKVDVEISEVFCNHISDENYKILNIIRKEIYKEKFDFSIKQLKNINFNELPDYYADIIYYLFLLKNDEVYEIFTHIREESLNRFVKYLNDNYDDLAKVILDFIDYQKNNLSEIRVNKSLSRYLLALENGLEKDNKSIIDNYLDAGFKYMEKVYTKKVFEDELIYELKNGEEAFLLYIYKAFKLKENNLKDYIRYLRKGIKIYPLMKNVVESLILEIKEERDKATKELEQNKNILKSKIEKMISNNNLVEAEEILMKYQQSFKVDEDIYSMKSVILISKGLLEEAKESLLTGLEIYPNSFDLNFNLSFVYENLDKIEKSINQYHQSKELAKNKAEIQEVEKSLKRIKTNNKDIDISTKEKIVFFCKEGLDNFIDDIITGLSTDYETKKVIVNKYAQIDKWMEWSDIVWFEWCDELVIYGSKLDLARDKKIVCRLHSYEAFTNYINKVNWSDRVSPFFI